jgi:hypothetical protein
MTPSDKSKTIKEPFSPNSFPTVLHLPEITKLMQKTRQNSVAGLSKSNGAEAAGRLLLPGTLLVAVRLEALPTFVFRHLQTSFLLQVAHR